MQAADGTVLITQNFPQYLIGVFTENRWGSADFAGRGRKFEWTAQQVHRSERAVLCADPHLPVEHLGIIQGFINPVDPAAGDPLGFQEPEPLAGASGFH